MIAFATAASWDRERRGRGIRGARRRGRPHRRQGRQVGRRLGRDPGAAGARPAAVRLLVPLRAGPCAAEAAGTARRGTRMARAGARVRERRPRGAGRRRLARASVRQPRVRDDGVALDPRARRAGRRAALARGGLEPAPYAGAFDGLYVDVVPPLLDGDRPLCQSVRLRLCGWRSGRHRPVVRAAPAAARVRDHGHGLQSAGVLQAARRRAWRASVWDASHRRSRRRSRRARHDSRERSASNSSCPRPGVAVVRRGRLPRRVGHAARCARGRACRSYCCHGARTSSRTRPAASAPVPRSCFHRTERRRTRSRQRCGSCSTEPRYAEAARRIASEFEQMGTPEEAAAAVEEHVGAR